MSDRVSPELASDQTLVAALKNGDELAFMTLVERYQSMLIRLALMYVNDRGAAEDVVQETWLGVLQGVERFEERSSFKTWLFRILTNRAKTRGVRDGRTVPFSAVIATNDGEDADTGLDRFFQPGHEFAGAWASLPTDWGSLPEARFLTDETRAVIDAAIERLPTNQQAVITLRDLDGWSADEVRNALDLSETNQRVLLHRARTKIRQALAEYLER